MVHIERDIRTAKEGGADNLVYKTIVGLKSDLSTAQKPAILGENADDMSGSEDDEDESDDGNSNSDEDITAEGDSKFKNSARPRDESPESKKVESHSPFVAY